jgi:hypothetical protein
VIEKESLPQQIHGLCDGLRRRAHRHLPQSAKRLAHGLEPRREEAALRSLEECLPLLVGNPREDGFDGFPVSDLHREL